jgi:hypothetical protein
VRESVVDVGGQRLGRMPFDAAASIVTSLRYDPRVGVM